MCWKETHTDRYQDFTSHRPLTNKIALARTLMTQVDRIYTHQLNKDKAKRHIAKALKNNGYPSHHVNKNLCTTTNPHQSRSPEDKPRATVVIPHICHLSESIQCCLVLIKIRTCFQPHCTLRQMLVHLKDQTPLNQRAGVIYEVPCGDCPKVYIGQTGRTLSHRLKVHKRALASGNLTQSAMGTCGCP